eukprot:1064907-Rhodomonas_salina.2
MFIRPKATARRFPRQFHARPETGMSSEVLEALKGSAASSAGCCFAEAGASAEDEEGCASEKVCHVTTPESCRYHSGTKLARVVLLRLFSSAISTVRIVCSEMLEKDSGLRAERQQCEMRRLCFAIAILGNICRGLLTSL